MKEFNHKKFMEVLLLAKGEHRTFYQFCIQCNIDQATISRVVNNRKHNLKPETLYAISQHAINDISYNDLMLAYGYEKEEIPNMLKIINEKETYEISKEYRDFINDSSNSKYINMLIDAKKRGLLDKLCNIYNNL